MPSRAAWLARPVAIDPDRELACADPGRLAAATRALARRFPDVAFDALCAPLASAPATAGALAVRARELGLAPPEVIVPVLQALCELHALT